VAREHKPTPDLRLLVALLAIALVVRLGWGLSRPADDAAIDLLPDQRGYLDAARNLLRGAGLQFVDPRFGPTVDGRPTGQTVYATRTPGYPAFVALCGGSVVAVRVVQAFIDTSTVLAIFLLARRFAGEARAAPLLAAAAVAFNPFLVYFSALLLTETLYASLLAWAMWLMVSARVWAAGVTPLFAGVALLIAGVYVRPSGVALPVLLAAATVLIDARHTPPSRPPRRFVVRLLSCASVVLIVGLITVAALVPWAARNDRVLGRWVWSTSNDGITAYDGFHPRATGKSDQRFLNEMPHVREMGELERSDFFADRAKELVREDPARAAGLAVRKVARTWSPVPLSEEFGRPMYRAAALLFALPFDVLAVAGAVTLRRRRAALLFLLLPALYFTAVHALSVGSLRYRVPAEPPLAVLAGLGAARLLSGRAPAAAAETSEDDALRASSSAE
jgi:4-amino-4-deoxy-L-arabinose transferase-like glycosyltransferase